MMCYLERMKTRGRLAIDALAEATAGYSGAELAAVCREAGLQAICRGLAKGTGSTSGLCLSSGCQRSFSGVEVQALAPGRDLRR
jgi:SpoVK/Ycf46/Vps4 family AAA+-type ATPase